MAKLNDFESNKRELNMDELEMVTGGDTIEVIDIFHNNNGDNNETPINIPTGRIKI